MLFPRGSSTRGAVLALAFSCLATGLAVPVHAQAPEGAIPAPATPPAQARKTTVFRACAGGVAGRSEEHKSELQSHSDIVCRPLLEKKKKRPISEDRTRRHRRRK